MLKFPFMHRYNICTVLFQFLSGSCNVRMQPTLSGQALLHPYKCTTTDIHTKEMIQLLLSHINKAESQRMQWTSSAPLKSDPHTIFIIGLILNISYDVLPATLSRYFFSFSELVKYTSYKHAIFSRKPPVQVSYLSLNH